MTSSQSAATLKEEGNTLFTQKKYKEARIKYTLAIGLDPSNPVLFANRAACNLSLKK
jgi:hypothetical protein